MPSWLAKFWRSADGKRPLLIVPLVVLGILDTTANAAARTVVLVSPPAPSALVSDALARIAGELELADFIPALRTADVAANPRATLEALARDAHCVAALAIIMRTGEADVWLTELRAGRSVVQRIGLPTEPARGAALVSFAAVELLRATLGELWPSAPLPSAPPVAEADARLKTSPAPAVADVWYLIPAALTRVYATSGLVGLGGSLNVSRTLGSRGTAGAELAVVVGSTAVSIGHVNAIASDAAVFVGLNTAPGKTRLAAELGARLGIVRLQAELDPQQLYRGKSAVGPWGGPAARASVRRWLGKTIALGATVETGWAAVATEGSSREDASFRVRLGGLWAALAIGMAF